jgi:hypothetical protein
LKPRAVRMPGDHIAARLDRHVVDVLNLSLTGALLRHNQGVPLDTQAMLALVHNEVAVTVHARVLRNTPAADLSGWHVAVTFPNASDHVRKAIPRLLTGNSRGY